MLGYSFIHIDRQINILLSENAQKSRGIADLLSFFFAIKHSISLKIGLQFLYASMGKDAYGNILELMPYMVYRKEEKMPQPNGHDRVRRQAKSRAGLILCLLLKTVFPDKCPDPPAGG